MEILFPLVLLAALFVAVDLLWFPPSRLHAVVVAQDTRRGRAVDTAPVEVGVEWSLFTLPVVRRRLRAVTDELERLERDPAIFARAFRTFVARSAYEALLVEESRLVAVPTLELEPRPGLEPAGRTTSRREELQL